jgi:tetratricopeptide (TPR) repeat protein
LRASLALVCSCLAFPRAARAAGLAQDPVQAEVAGFVGSFYDLQLDTAAAAAARLEARRPGHPAGPFFKGMHAYLALLVQENLSTSTVAAFEAEMGRCIEAADANKGLPPVVSKYYLAGALGFRARVSVMRGNWLDAVRDARRAVDNVRDAFLLDPELDDVYLGMGMYHYYLGDLPAPVKPFAFLLTGLWGDREKGLAELERATRSPVAGPEAMSVLAFIYDSGRENQREKADAWMARLSAAFPRNPAFRVWRAHANARRGRLQEALAILDLKGNWMSGVSKDILPAGRAHALYLAAEIQLMSGAFGEAQASLDALSASGVPPILKDWVLLRRANLLDARDRRSEALPLYRQVRGEAAKPAAAFLSEPFPRGPRDLMPLRWPRFALPS